MADAGKDTIVARNAAREDPTLLGVNEPNGAGLPGAFSGLLNAAGEVAGAVYNVTQLFKSPDESVQAQANVTPEPAPEPAPPPAPPAPDKTMLWVLAAIAGALLLALKLD